VEDIVVGDRHPGSQGTKSSGVDDCQSSRESRVYPKVDSGH
jgi:hypothetical protein